MSIIEQFAGFIRKSGGNETAITAAGELCSGLIEGHICRSLHEIFPVEDIAKSRDELLENVTVGRPGDFKPIILDDRDNIYLYRYWKYENDLATRFSEMAKERLPLDSDLLTRGITRLFPSVCNETDWQKIAALAAVCKRLCIISGGPGTGKSTTVRKIIELAFEQAKGEQFRIALAAPTGKAAARLRETLLESCVDGAIEQGKLPKDVFTLHRLLGAVQGSTRFRHNSDNPLKYELVVIDEASMVPLPLMAKLVDALPPHGRLILLGDKDQLSSVEPGAVLGELCGKRPEKQFSKEFAELTLNISGYTLTISDDDEQISPMNDSVVILRKSYRFHDQSGIGRLSRLINESRSSEAIELLENNNLDDICFLSESVGEKRKKALKQLVLERYGDFIIENDPLSALKKFEKFRVLCAMRTGPAGVEEINREIVSFLASEGMIFPDRPWYSGRPVMVTVNDYWMKLFNGDIGICLPDQEQEGEIAVYFQDVEMGVKKISPSRLPEHETVFAMTVHKSQGSEFESILLLLPETDSKLLTRELIYTGITRAKKQIHLWSSPDILKDAVSRKIKRDSGLGIALWGE